MEIRATKVYTPATTAAVATALKASATVMARIPTIIGQSTQTVSFFSPTDTPTVVTATEGVSIELGIKFAVTADTHVLGIKFYKGPQNTGTHTGTLWAPNGTPIATVTFTNETATGWQTATFPTPVPITANTTYTASYLAPVGRYSATNNFFTTQTNSGILYAPIAAGVYLYSGGYPTNTFQNTNYFVDVIVAAVAGPPPPGGGGLPALWNATPPTGVCPAPSGPVVGQAGQFDTGILAQNEIWDHFNGTAGTNPDTRLWLEDTINQGGQQTYNTANTFLDGNSNLVFEATRQSLNNYTSGRLTSRSKFNMQYGWLAASIKFPSSVGFFPAWWVLHIGINTGAPYGEIDMMEYFGPATIYTSNFHFGGAADSEESTKDVPASHGENAGNAFHTYWMLWEPDRIEIGVDDLSVGVWDAARLSNPSAWAPSTQQPHYYIWNFAVHPTFLPAPPAGAFPAQMLTDWIWYKPLNLL